MEAMSYPDSPRGAGLRSVPDALVPDGATALEAIVRRVAGVQVEGERLVEQLLADLLDRLEVTERTLLERMDAVTAHVDARLTAFEESALDRMAAYEVVLRRIVERVSASETNLTDALDHRDRLLARRLDAVRADLQASSEQTLAAIDETAAGHERFERLEGAVEDALARAADAVETSERVVQAHLDSLRPAVEAAVLATLAPALTRALEQFRTSVDEMARNVVHEVETVARGPAPSRSDRPLVDAVQEASPPPGVEPLAPPGIPPSPFPGFVPVGSAGPEEAHLVEDDGGDGACADTSAPIQPRARRRAPSRRPRPLRAR